MQETTLTEAPQTQVLLADVPPTKASATAAPLTPSIPLALVKQDYRQPKTYPKQANIVVLLDICFLVDKFDKIINKNANIKPAYTINLNKKK